MAGPRRDPTNRFFPMTGSKVPLSPTTGTEQAFSQPDSLANILPPHLRAEQPTILAAKYGEVTNAAQQLCLIANRLGRKYGVHGAPFFYDKEEVTPADADNNHWLLKAFAEFSMAFYGRMPYLQITRSSKIDWVVFYGEQPGLGLANKGDVGTLVPVSEASIEVKQVALRHSKELFARYLRQVKSAVSDIDKDLIVASRTIEDLANL